MSHLPGGTGIWDDSARWWGPGVCCSEGREGSAERNRPSRLSQTQVPALRAVCSFASLHPGARTSLKTNTDLKDNLKQVMRTTTA